jgi:hypothetical protein
MKRYLSLAVLMSAALLTACEKNAVQDITGTVPGSAVRFFNFGVNAPSVNFYANDRKMTAISSATGTESTNGTAYGSVGSGGYYSGIEPGQYTFFGKISATTDKDLAIASIPGTLADGKNYSVYLSGFYNTAAKTVDGFIVEDAYPAAFDYTVAYVRFVNAISNSNPMTLYAKNQTTGTETAVGAVVAYKNGGAFIALPGGFYDLGARVAGSATNAISRTAVQFVNGKTYTISARGDMTVVSTTATNRPFLDNTANR